jgi:predicted dehydrogenase
MLKRRDFLKLSLQAGAAAALPTIIPSSALGKDGAVAPSERIVMAQIGYGGRGRQMLDNFLPWPQVRFVAACETQLQRLNDCKQRIDAQYGNADCAVYRDLRELLAREDIDAVLIVTGERWHAPASILAARAGKDVYSEKPISLTLAEGRRLVEEVERHGVVYQGGTQRRNVGNFAAAVELARSGRLGRLKTLYASINGVETFDAWLPRTAPPARAGH